MVLQEGDQWNSLWNDPAGQELQCPHLSSRLHWTRERERPFRRHLHHRIPPLRRPSGKMAERRPTIREVRGHESVQLLYAQSGNDGGSGWKGIIPVF